jgi:uncharacterized damage-inducible protein DinB
MAMELPRYAFKGEIGRSFPELSAALLQEYADKIRIGLGRLSEEQVWWRPNRECNSAGNLVLHICGNLSLWVLGGLGGIEYERDRAGEFRARRTKSKAELLAYLQETVGRCRKVLEKVNLDQRLSLQGYDVDGRAALYHTVEHASQHTGQILFIVKQLAPGFEFYPQHADE